MESLGTNAVRSAAFNLAGKKAGIRLEFPDTFRPSLRALELVAYNLKKSNPSMKWNVKFDDKKLDLVMDIKLSESSTWKKIRPGQAMAARELGGPPDDGEEEMAAHELQSFMGGPRPRPPEAQERALMPPPWVLGPA